MVFLVDQNIKSQKDQNVENVFWVDHYYDDQNIEKNIEIDFRCSDFTYGVEKDHYVESLYLMLFLTFWSL